VVDGDPVECDSCYDEEECHSPYGAERHTASTESINDHEIDPGEDEVRGGNDGPHRYRTVETDHGKNSRRVVHETVEASKLADSHETTGGNKGAKVTRNDVKLLEEPDVAFAVL